MSEVLVIAPHPDDEVLGCGGTIARHVWNGDEVTVCIVTETYTPDWPPDQLTKRRKQALKAHRLLGIKETHFLCFPTVRLDTVPQKELNDKIAQIVNQVRPELVYLPHRGDINRDHRLVFDAGMVAARPKPGSPIRRLLSYETLSETEWNAPFTDSAFLPNVYVDISETIDIKQKAMSVYTLELREFPHPRSLEAIAATAHARGATIGVRAAEAFVLIRELWNR